MYQNVSYQFYDFITNFRINFIYSKIRRFSNGSPIKPINGLSGLGLVSRNFKCLDSVFFHSDGGTSGEYLIKKVS